MAFLYNIIIHLYLFLIRIFSLFNGKARTWLRGRKGIFTRISGEVDPDSDLAWFHCASLGEFEQGRPVIEAFKKKYPGYRIMVTFFSPSGYEVRKNYDGADHIFYLPIDTQANSKRFIDLTRPTIAFFIKYEYWFNYLAQLHKRNIPVIGVSSIFRPGQRFFRWYGGWQRSLLAGFAHFFVQDETSEKLLEEAGISQVSIGGDTRFDRVFEIAGRAGSFPLVEKFKGTGRIFIAGSTWPPDESLILELIHKNHSHLKFVIAPHEVHKDRIDGLMKRLPAGSLRFSELTESNAVASKILVIDNIGILSHLYQYGNLAHIGGGFGVGIHNILEAATFGLPVTFGPNYHKFREARELAERGGAFPVDSEREFIEVINKLLRDDSFLEKTSAICKSFVNEKRGATGKVMKYAESLIKAGA